MLLCTQASSNWNWEPVIISPTQSVLLLAELKVAEGQSEEVKNWLESSLSQWWLFEGLTDIKIFLDSDAEEVCVLISFDQNLGSGISDCEKTLRASFKSKETSGLLSSYFIKKRKCELIE